MNKLILFATLAFQSITLFAGNLKITTDPKITQLIVVIDHKGGEKTKFEKVKVGDWDVDQFGNKSRQIFCVGNGGMSCCASLAFRPNPTPWDALIEQQCDALQLNILDCFIGGQLNGSINTVVITNDPLVGPINIVASWTPVDADKIRINYTIIHN